MRGLDFGELKENRCIERGKRSIECWQEHGVLDSWTWDCRGSETSEV